MATGLHSKPTFTPYRKWAIGLNMVILAVVVLAVVVMINYISQDYFLRFYASTRNQIELSQRTVGLLRSLTNRVKITLYYDTEDKHSLFGTVSDLLTEYQHLNPRIVVQTVDYIRSPTLAQKVKADYKLSGPTDKDLIIFDCEGKVKTVPGNGLANYVVEPAVNPEGGSKQPRLDRRPAAFLGEMAFTAALLDVTSSKPLNAYFLVGHDEHPIDSGDENNGYLKFASILQHVCITPQPLSLLGTNTVPADCKLLVIAGARDVISEAELGKIDRYLNQGGRLLVLFHYASSPKRIGLEDYLARWGVNIGHNVVADPENTKEGTDIIVSNFGDGKHPVVNSLVQSQLHLSLPRTIGRLKSQTEAADAPRVDEIAFSGPHATAVGTPPQKPPFPLMVALEKGAIKDVITDRGATRMVIVGDSIFLGNIQIDSVHNRDFAINAVNWLLERPQLLAGLGPRPLNWYRVAMTRTQTHQAQWVLLGGLPGGVLLLGGLVWLRRRK